MTERNAVGDLVLTSARAMRALASSEALALHDALRGAGPVTAEQLAPQLGSSAAAVAARLEALADVGLAERVESVDGSATRWAAIGRGFVFEIPDDPEGQTAARELSNAMLLRYVDLPRTWVEEVEPQLPLAWARASGLLNARFLATPQEARDIQQELERVLEPYLTREPAPDGAAHVRILAYFMPETGDSSRS